MVPAEVGCWERRVGLVGFVVFLRCGSVSPVLRECGETPAVLGTGSQQRCSQRRPFCGEWAASSRRGRWQKGGGGRGMSSPCSFLHLATGFFAVPPSMSHIKGSPCPPPSRCQFYAPLLSPLHVLVLQSAVALPLLSGEDEPLRTLILCSLDLCGALDYFVNI